MAHRIVDLRSVAVLDAATTPPWRWPAGGSAGGGAAAAGRMLALLVLWYQRSRQRRELRGLPTELLRDIGIDRIDALHEARKPFWRA